MPLAKAGFGNLQVDRCIWVDTDAKERDGAALPNLAGELKVLDLLHERTELVIEEYRIGGNPRENAVALRGSVLQRPIACDEQEAE
jgi:hypothetical protein